MRRVAYLVVVAALAAGCGSRQAAAPTRTGPGPGQAGVRPVPDPRTRPDRAEAVQVTVVDGDLGTRVGGARVQIGRLASRSNASGVARIPLGRRGALVTVASKPGYAPRAVRLAFRTHPKSTIRIYRQALQWAMYGAGPERTQQQPAIRLRPPFRVVWSRGLGSLVEFPAVVADGVAYIANAEGTVRALDMRDGTVVWRHDTPNGKMASSPAVVGDEIVVHGMDGYVQVLSRSDGHLLWRFSTGSPIESSPVVLPGGIDVFGTWDGLGDRARPGHPPRSLALPGRLQDHLVRGGGRRRRLPRRLLRAADRTLRLVRSPALERFRQRARLRDAGGRRRARVRPELDRRLDDRLLGRRCPALDALDGLLCLLLAGGGRTGASSSARTTASSTRCRPATGRRSGPASTGGPISGAAVVVDGVAYAGSFAHRILGVDTASGRVVLDFPHGEYVPVAGGGRRLLLHGYSRIFAVERR